MSNKAISWAWTVPTQPTCKFVLIAIADRADGSGECFPSVRDLVERTGLTDRAIQKSIDRLVTEGWLQRTFRAGRSTIYRVSMSAQTPERGSPPNVVHPRTTFTTLPNDVHPSPERGSPHPRTTFPHNPHLTQTEPKPNPQSGADADAPTPDKLTGGLFDDASPPAPAAEAEPAKPAQPEPPVAPAKGPKTASRLRDDWEPDATHLDFAEKHGVDGRREGQKFRNHWTSKSGKDGTKLDWWRTWQNWVLTAEERMASYKPRPAKTSQMTVDEQNADLMRRMQAALGQGDKTQATLRLVQ